MNLLNNNILKRKFGYNKEYNIVDIPKFISNVRFSRIEYGEKMGCSICFPHGPETVNSTSNKNFKSWKFKRKKQWDHSKKNLKRNKASRNDTKILNDNFKKLDINSDFKIVRFYRQITLMENIIEYKWPYNEK